ncbi:MAG TPA: flagellar hook-associated protein FlgK [Gammaproteobacteria bacterium]|nr:flagellar hook-associated protein FlgK [Gammaproteobacteria bacterium]
MGLTQALTSALSGLQVNQASISLVAANVANAGTPGYTRKTVDQVASAGSGTSIGVRISEVQRAIDQYVQRQLRVENSGASYADTRAQIYDRLQDIYGTPGSDSTLESVFNKFTSTLQALSTSPDDAAARSAVISSAQLVAQQLNHTSDAIQSLRGDAEFAISSAVTQANYALSQIASINQKLSGLSTQDSQSVTLMDQRDAYIDQLSKLMDINVIQSDHNQVNILTNSGLQLVGAAATLSFNAQGTMTAASRWNADPALSTVGTITLTSPGGSTVDLLANNAIRSGSIAAYVQMRDQDLVQAQNQIDAVAAAMASALSDRTVDGTAVTAGAQAGFDVDIGSLSAGNTITINYTDVGSGTARTMTLVRVDDPSVLPLSDSATTDPNDTVVGIDFSGGIASVITQINTAFAGTGMTASNPSGTTLEILDDGAAGTVNVDGVSATVTVTSLLGGSAELPFFTDGSGTPYTGAISALGTQSIGLAGRIAVNAALAADPSKLVLYAATTAAGDSTRPDFLYRQLTATSLTYAPDTGIGTETSPFSGSLTTFLRQVIAVQGEAANSAQNLKQGQDVVVNALQQRFDDASGVNIDEEMANLLTLQNSYAANARVMSTVKEMLDALLRM